MYVMAFRQRIIKRTWRKKTVKLKLCVVFMSAVPMMPVQYAWRTQKLKIWLNHAPRYSFLQNILLLIKKVSTLQIQFEELSAIHIRKIMNPY